MLNNDTRVFLRLKIQVKVLDRTAVVTTNAETMVVKPPGLQEAINAETGKQLYMRERVIGEMLLFCALRIKLPNLAGRFHHLLI